MKRDHEELSEKKESVTDRKISRRSILKYTAALAGGVVVGVAAEYGATYKPPPPPPPSFKPPLSPEVSARIETIKKNLLAKHDGEIIRYTNCENSGCHMGCIMKVRIKDGKITAVEADDSVNSGVTRDDAYLSMDVLTKGQVQTRGCPVTYAYPNEIYSPNRVMYPMKRVGNRGEGKFARISWDQAIDEISKIIQTVKEKYGPYSVWHMPYSSSQYISYPPSYWYKQGIVGWSASSTNGWEQPQKWVTGAGLLTQDPPNVLNSKLIVLWGQNPVFTIWGVGCYFMALAREKGIPVIAIDQVHTMSVKTLADQWIPIRPGTDVAMMIGMANVLFKENLVDQDFVNTYVEPTGLKKWTDYVLGKSDGVDKTPEWAEKISGVPAETIRELARLWARSKPVNLNMYGSTGRQFYGENQARAAMYLQALTGNYMKPGTNIFGEPGVAVGDKPTVDYKQAPQEYVPPTMFLTIKCMKSVALRPQLDSGQMTQAQFNGLIGNVSTSPSPNIKLLFLENNYTTGVPDTNQTIRALKLLDGFIAIGEWTDEPAPRYADYLLPAVYSAFESRSIRSYGIGRGREDLFRRGTGFANSFYYMQKSIDAPGECRPHNWFWTNVMIRLGIAEKSNPVLAKVAWPWDSKTWEGTMEQMHKDAYETWASKNTKLNPPTWDDFQKKPIFRWDIKPQYPYQSLVETGVNPFRLTASKKFEMYSDYLATGPDNLAKTDNPKGSGVCYGPGNLPPMAQWAEGRYDHFYSPDVKKYPLLLSSLHSPFRVHSFHNNNMLMKDQYRHACWISAVDAKLRGINDGDLVHVYNDLAEMVVPAYVTSRLVPGVVNIGWGGWYAPSATKTALMPDGIDREGAHNFFTHNEDVPYTINGYLNCKATVQVEKF